MSIKSLETLEVWKKAKDFSIEQDGEKLTQLTNGYVGYLKRSKQGQNEPGANRVAHEDAASYETDLTETD